MRTLQLFVLALTVWPSAAACQDIVATATFGAPNSGRQSSWNKHHNEYVGWSGDKVVGAGRSGFVRCFDPQTKRQLWSTHLGAEINGMSIATKIGRVFLEARGNAIHVLRLTDGKTIESVAPGELQRHAGSYVVPTYVCWIPGLDQLLVTAHADGYGDNGFLFDGVTFKRRGKLKCDGFVTDATSSAGRYIVTLSYRNNIRIWDAKRSTEVLKHGWDKRSPIDAPFMSNVRFDADRTLIYTVDDYWRTGKVFVYDTVANRQRAKFSSRNGHVVMDVDFAHGRIALTGTQRGLTVCDLNGKVLAEKKDVALQRNIAIAFSPTGERLAIGSFDGTLRVFELATTKPD